MVPSMTLRGVNLLNVGLLALSALVAWVRPFELFLFAYGVLGPLHYLTEISWLHDRRWFGTSTRDWVVPTIAALGGTAAYVAGRLESGPPPLTVEAFGTGLRVSWAQLMTLTAVGAGFAAAFVRGTGRRIVSAAVVATVGVGLVQTDAGRLLVGVFLITLVHVFVFTSCFILYGALRNRSASGYAVWVAHLAIPVAMLALSWSGPVGVVVSSGDLQRSAPFHTLLVGICRVLGVPEDRGHATAAMRVVAYAYTYHYLNWFSKTETVRWHDAPRGRLAWIAAAWIASVAIYVVDWNLAFVLLLALSVAHVYLEFPLNWRTAVGIAGELREHLTGRPAATGST